MEEMYGLSLTFIETPDYFYFKSRNNETTTLSIEWISVPSDVNNTPKKEFYFSFDKIHWSGPVSIGDTVTFDNYVFLKAADILWHNREFNYTKLTVNKPCDVGGELAYLVHPDKTGATAAEGLFSGLFYNNTNIVDASKLKFINTDTIYSRCYQLMFNGCTALTTPPSFSSAPLALNLGNYCYSGMYNNCTSLEKLPAFPQNALLHIESCVQMFKGCTNIKICASQGYMDGITYSNSYAIPALDPEEDPLTSYPVNEMFENTGGYTTTVSPGTTYYSANEVI